MGRGVEGLGIEGHGVEGFGEQTHPGPTWSPTPVDMVAETEHMVAQFAQGQRFAPWSEQLVAMRSMIDQLEALWLAEVGGFEQADGPADDGSVSLSSWLRHRCRIAPTEAKHVRWLRGA